MQHELVELKEVRDAALEVAEAMDIPVRDGDEPLTRREASQGAWSLQEVYFPHYPPVRGSRTGVGEVLLADHSSGHPWTRS